MRRRCLMAALGLAFALGALGSATAEAERAFVLVSESPRLLAVDIGTGATLAEVALEGKPELLVRTPNGKRLLVFDWGAAKPGRGPKPAVTIVDPVAMQALSRVTLGWRPALGDFEAVPSPGETLRELRAAVIPRWTTSDGRWLVVSCSGVESKKPEERAPAELILVDLDQGRVGGTIPLARPADGVRVCQDGKRALVFWSRLAPKKGPQAAAEAAIFDIESGRELSHLPLAGSPTLPFFSADGATAVFFAPRIVSKKAPPIPASLQFIDLAAGQVSPPFELEGEPGVPQLSADGRFLYLLERGKPSGKPEKNINGRIQVFSMATRSLEINLDAGSDPRRLIPDAEGNQFFVLSEAPPVPESKTRVGELRVLRGSEIYRTLQVAEEPEMLRIADDHERLYVIGKKDVTDLDLPALQVLGNSPLDRPGGAAVTEFAANPGGARAVALFSASSRLSVLDCSGHRHVGSVATGRGSKKFLKNLGAIAASVALSSLSYYGGYQAALASGSNSFYYNIYSFRPAAPNTALVVRPDGKFVYALNTQTNDVTIVDTEAATAVEKIPATGRRIKMFPGGKTLAVVGGDAIHMVDMTAQKKGADLAFGQARDIQLVFSKDGDHAIAAGGDTVFFLDGSTGETRARLAGVAGVQHVVLEEAIPPPAGETPADAQPEAPPAAQQAPPPATPGTEGGHKPPGR